jgi:CelD/BcsL family acetyltransferase involved in cellulose biosynthesis
MPMTSDATTTEHAADGTRERISGPGKAAATDGAPAGSPGGRWIGHSELEARRDEWLELAASSEFPAAFADPRWVLPWWSHYGEGREDWFFALEDAHGSLRGLALLACEPQGRGRTLGFAGDRWNGLDTLLWAPGAEQEVTEALIEALFERRGEWDVWRIRRLAKSSRLAHELLGGGAKLRSAADDVRLQPYVTLPDEIDEFESRYGGKRRTEFRRRWRRLTELGADMQTIEDGDQAEAAVHDLLELRHARAIAAGVPHVHMDERFERFTVDTVRAFLPGGVRLSTLTLDGKLLTSKLNFVESWREHGFISAVSDEHLSLSPGHALERQRVHAMISHGCREFDLGPGRDEYKYHWGAVDREVARIIVVSPTARGRLTGGIASADLRLRNTRLAEAMRRRRGIVPERATPERPAVEPDPPAG